MNQNLFQKRTETYSVERYGTADNREAASVFEDDEIHFRKEIPILVPHFQQDLYLENESFLSFQFVLPHQIPTSFEHSIGRTRYTIEALIEISL